MSPAGFALRWGIALPLVVGLYWPLRDAHQALVVRSAAWFLAGDEPPLGLRIDDASGQTLAWLSSEQAVSIRLNRSTLDLLLVGMVLLVSLLVVAPGRRHLGRSLLGLAALLALESTHLVEVSRALHTQLNVGASPWTRAVEESAGFVALAVALAIWILAGGRSLFATPKARPVASDLPPQGSGG